MNIQLICETMGTVAFAISGGMLAIERKMDIFGVLVMGLVTALGGGLMRDVILHITPPGMFANPVNIWIALLASSYAFLMIRWKHPVLPYISEKRFHWILNLTDAIGLGMFSAVGVDAAINAGFAQYDIFAVFLGMLTGVGGGMIRDILAGLTPSILMKNIYACASLLGAVSYHLMMKYAPGNYAMFVSAGIVIAVRVAAYHWKWNLPRAIE